MAKSKYRIIEDPETGQYRAQEYIGLLVILAWILWPIPTMNGWIDLTAERYNGRWRGELYPTEEQAEEAIRANKARYDKPKRINVVKSIKGDDIGEV